MRARCPENEQGNNIVHWSEFDRGGPLRHPGGARSVHRRREDLLPSAPVNAPPTTSVTPGTHARVDYGYDRLPVSEHSRQEVARRAGVDPGYVDRLVELGILRPGAGGAFSQGDARRARWVHGLERSGVPLDRMAAAVRDGALSFSFLDA